MYSFINPFPCTTCIYPCHLSRLSCKH